MNAAFVYGKSGEEDLLTSDIFGLLKYPPPHLVLWPLLQKSECFDKPERYRIADQMGRVAPVSADFFFWPHTGAGQEPDLLLMLCDESGDTSAIVIEVKFHSGKHDLHPSGGADDVAAEQRAHESSKSGNANVSDRDQLGDYFFALLANEIFLRPGQTASGALAKRIEKQMREGERILRSPRTKKFLIYLTEHASPPEDDIKRTLDSVKKAVQADDWSGRMHWLGWRSLYEVADVALNDSRSHLEGLQREILWDILRLLDLRNLRPFKGWKDINLDISVTDHGNFSFWHPHWFRGISVPELEFCASSYFWRQLERGETHG